MQRYNPDGTRRRGEHRRNIMLRVLWPKAGGLTQRSSRQAKIGGNTSDQAMMRRGSVQLLSLDRGMFERLVEVPEDQLGAALAAAAIELIASVGTLQITDRIEVIDPDED